jgi:hypothetical protein
LQMFLINITGRKGKASTSFEMEGNDFLRIPSPREILLHGPFGTHD